MVIIQIEVLVYLLAFVFLVCILEAYTTRNVANMFYSAFLTTVALSGSFLITKKLSEINTTFWFLFPFLAGMFLAISTLNRMRVLILPSFLFLRNKYLSKPWASYLFISVFMIPVAYFAYSLDETPEETVPPTLSNTDTPSTPSNTDSTPTPSNTNGLALGLQIFLIALAAVVVPLLLVFFIQKSSTSLYHSNVKLSGQETRKPNQTEANWSEPNQTEANRSEPNQTKPNRSKLTLRVGRSLLNVEKKPSPGDGFCFFHSYALELLKKIDPGYNGQGYDPAIGKEIARDALEKSKEMEMENELRYELFYTPQDIVQERNLLEKWLRGDFPREFPDGYFWRPVLEKLYDRYERIYLAHWSPIENGYVLNARNIGSESLNSFRREDMVLGVRNAHYERLNPK